jgi:hypothetical protein
MGKLTIISAACCTLVLFMSAPALAKKPPCSRNEMAIADERGGKICLKKSEWQKARKICAKNHQRNAMDCICQDGDSVGACGN